MEVLELVDMHFHKVMISNWVMKKIVLLAPSNALVKSLLSKAPLSVVSPSSVSLSESVTASEYTARQDNTITQTAFILTLS